MQSTPLWNYDQYTWNTDYVPTEDLNEKLALEDLLYGYMQSTPLWNYDQYIWIEDYDPMRKLIDYVSAFERNLKLEWNFESVFLGETPEVLKENRGPMSKLRDYVSTFERDLLLESNFETVFLGESPEVLKEKRDPIKALRDLVNGIERELLLQSNFERVFLGGAPDVLKVNHSVYGKRKAEEMDSSRDLEEDITLGELMDVNEQEEKIQEKKYSTACK